MRTTDLETGGQLKPSSGYAAYPRGCSGWMRGKQRMSASGASRRSFVTY